MQRPLQEPRFPRWLIAVVVVVALGIVAGGLWFYNDQNQGARTNADRDLLAIGRLKAEQIMEWRADRLGDARVIAGNPASAALAARWLGSRQSSDSAAILAWFRAIQQGYEYANVLLVDASGKVQLGLTQAGVPLTPDTIQGVQTALAGRTANLTDLHFAADHATIVMDVVAPLLTAQDSSGQQVGAVIMTANAGDFLFPLIQSWPTASTSAETLLVRREDGQVLYLNELRHQKDTALKLKIPLTQKNVPAVMAVLGTQGVVQGLDYRGVKVVAAVQSVPDSPWFIVAKIDTSEAFAGARFRSLLILILTILILAALVGGTLFVWQRNLKQRYQEAYDSEVSHQALLARYEHLVQEANDIILLGDEDQRTVEANERAVEAYGYSREELLGLRIPDLMPTEEAAAFEERTRELEEKGSYIREATHRRKDGSVFPVEISGRTISMDNKRYLQVIIRDISERKKVEAVLRASRERYQAIAQATAQIIWVSDPEGNVVEDLPTMQEYTGLSKEELAGSLWETAVHPDDLAHAAEVRAHAIAARSLYEVEYRLRRADGEYRHFWVRGVPVFDGDGDVLEWVGACMDITDRKRAEAERLQLERQFQQSQRLESLGVLAGGIAHDFNNILMAVLGYADLAMADLPLTAPARDNVKEIARAARRAAELCRQMLAYSGRGHFVVEVIDLHDLIDDMIHLLSSSISKKILLNLNLEKNLPPIMGDASQIDQVLMNLVINASEAIGERSGVITISTGAMECSREYLRDTYLDQALTEGLYVTLEVSDTGVGMDQDTMSHLFEPFFTTKFTGRGLGLAAVLGIVRGHRGAIKVYSEETRGTTFKLLFPAAESERGAAMQSGEGLPAWQGSGTVLLVDDEETIRALGSRMLERLGFDVVTAADGLEALDAYRARRDDIVLVLLDLTMPHMNGEETFRELRRIDPAVKVIMSSGYTESDITSRFAGKGLAGFVQKPYSLELLALRLSLALTRPDQED